MTAGMDAGFALVRIGKRTSSWKNFMRSARLSLAAVTVPLITLLIVSTAVAYAQTFTTLVNFDGYHGASPEFHESLAQGLDGKFYGTVGQGGNYSGACAYQGCGTVFNVSRTGTLTTLLEFDQTDGGGPAAGLVLTTNGDFYGTTVGGGAYGLGTVFKITARGTLTTLHSFCAQPNGQGYCPDGNYIYTRLTQGSDGNFYGTTLGGAYNEGTIFKITPGGVLTTLYSFCAQPACPDGVQPGALIQGTDGNFYGTTASRGTNGAGTVFKITAKGVLTTLHNFAGLSDGNDPAAGLVQGTDGNFYGTTSFGGANDLGTFFKITPAGALTTLYSFGPCCSDGRNPTGALIQATDGNFYGTTSKAGANNNGGTVFKISPQGALTTLYSFCAQIDQYGTCTDGKAPSSGLVQATDGSFYGTTLQGGTSNDGTVFNLSVGLGPHVVVQPTSGKVGAKVIVLGTNLTGASGVSFNGTTATFSVVSSSEIKATVPSGATTGFATVTTPSGTLTSNTQFRVIPKITAFSPTSGAPGTVVTITGTSLAQTTSVTFGGVAATAFTVNSDTQVISNVPTGAKTGKIAVTTPGGTAISTNFTVTP